ncbi:prepilin-type N-terminal cleavage/methylation domain-containing protein [Corallococcus macrosporus]|uniref:Prepilin-type N-terminal cleavage/methylation domain-containing protein n=1 Tax=Myxococcus fulvus (strain ATCC BAA-855 / HW-1) TaxID=483219 RepID=F8CJD0_MYXFH|nr:prepilin-type N-terminal cleavage/methylation domain-containing protein [Corallococcus macrosporus]AEI62643.1 prepilin-type N-terminal cleavage/methylation domain-containing protein [Corallococcus macrosporus]
MKRLRSTPRRGFTLIELMVAAAMSMVVLAAAIGVSAHLQRRGLLEERIMETQNKGRAARDLMAFGVQRAGAGIGSVSLTGGRLPSGEADLFHAVWARPRATFADDPGFAPPDDPSLLSDALEVWETDPARMVFLEQCPLPAVAAWNEDTLCLGGPPPAFLDDAVIAVVFPGTDDARGWACVGQVTNLVAEGVEWAPGIPGRAAPAEGDCTLAAATAGSPWAGTQRPDEGGMYLLPLGSRSYRVNWASGPPVLEMDADGPAGPAGYTAVSQDIEQLQVRLGVMAPDAPPDTPVRFFPDTETGRPSLATCTQATCATHVSWAWDPGVPVPPDRGPGSAGDELMRHVRVVELSITARSERVERLGNEAPGARDDEGNLRDGYKRRHSVIRLAPRNFAFDRTGG